MFLLVVGLVVFLGAHSLAIFAPGARARLLAQLGPIGFRAAYGLVSAVGLVAIVYGYGLAREAPVVLWDPPVAARHIVLLLMVPVFPLLLAAYLPGKIKATLKHPMLAAVKLWALGHLLANGTLADLLLFGAFLAWGVLDRISLKRRPGVTPPAPVKGFTVNDGIAVVAGLALYALTVFHAHEWLIGVAPIG